MEAMASYRLHRIKESLRQPFRLAPHTSGVSIVKPKDYEPGEVVEAGSPYAAWEKLRRSDQALHVGDMLEIEDGVLRIYKYVGFEEAKWFVPEPLLPTPLVASEVL